MARLKFLLDTQIWIWSESEPKRLSRRVTRFLSDPRHELWLSPISLWEIILLSRKGRITLKDGPSVWVSRSLAAALFREAPLTHEVALATEDIVLAHLDPADKLLAATAKVYGLTLITADENLIRGKGYSVLANQT